MGKLVYCLTKILCRASPRILYQCFQMIGQQAKCDPVPLIQGVKMDPVSTVNSISNKEKHFFSHFFHTLLTYLHHFCDFQLISWLV